MVFSNGHTGDTRVMHDLSFLFRYERRYGQPHKNYFPVNSDGRWGFLKKLLPSAPN
ncbi:MAG TPA: hypothetical protein VND64_00535 [Pirellulales bacterium]|nr:hypothetical protein [Pirellulales bacterium]